MGIKVPEDWQGSTKIPLDFSNISGHQENEIGDNLEIFPDGKFVSFQSTDSQPYKVAFRAIVMRTEDPSRISDATFFFYANASRQCAAKVTVPLAGSRGEVEWKEYISNAKIDNAPKQFSFLYGGQLRRSFIRTDGKFHQNYIVFECTSDAPFKIYFDVMATGYLELE